MTYHRIALERYLKQYSKFVSGEILDVGSKNRRYDTWFHGNVTAVDIVPVPEYNVLYGDIIDLHFAEESFDAVMALEVLEYVHPRDIETAVGQLFKVLKKGGYLLIGVPFLCPEHHDRIRPTLTLIQEMLSSHNPSKINSHKLGNAYFVCWDLLRNEMRRLKPGIFRKLVLIAGIVVLRILVRLFHLDEIEDDSYLGVYLTVIK